MSEFDTEAVKDHLEDLSTCLEELQASLSPLGLKESIGAYCEREQCDAIQKAKMFVLLGYAVHSLLFCYLKSSAAPTDLIMNELQRIKQYVGKIQQATAHQQRLTINKTAVARILEHDLSGNNHDSPKEEHTVGKHTRFSHITEPQGESLFDESKAEKKNRERRERKVAKKERHKKTKAKQAAKLLDTQS